MNCLKVLLDFFMCSTLASYNTKRQTYNLLYAWFFTRMEGIFRPGSLSLTQNQQCFSFQWVVAFALLVRVHFSSLLDVSLERLKAIWSCFLPSLFSRTAILYSWSHFHGIVQLTFAQQRHIFQLIGHTFFWLDTCRRLWQTPDKGITRPFLFFHSFSLKGPKKRGTKEVIKSHIYDLLFQLACHTIKSGNIEGEKVDNALCAT